MRITDRRITKDGMSFIFSIILTTLGVATITACSGRVLAQEGLNPNDIGDYISSHVVYFGKCGVELNQYKNGLSLSMYKCPRSAKVIINEKSNTKRVLYQNDVYVFQKTDTITADVYTNGKTPDFINYRLWPELRAALNKE